MSSATAAAQPAKAEAQRRTFVAEIEAGVGEIHGSFTCVVDLDVELGIAYGSCGR